MSTPEGESNIYPIRSEIDLSSISGEYMDEAHLSHIRETWLNTTIDSIQNLVPSTTEYVEFEPHNSDKEGLEVVQLPVEHGMDRKKKIIISAAAAATLAGFGIAVLMRGRFSPKAHKE